MVKKNNITTLDKVQKLSDALNNQILKAINDIINDYVWRYTSDRPSVEDSVEYHSILELTPSQFERIVDAIYSTIRSIAFENENNIQLYHSANLFKYFVDDYAAAVRVLNLNEKKGEN